MLNILVVGSEENLKECQSKFGDNHNYQLSDHSQIGKYLKPEMIVFDFEPNDVSVYNKSGVTVFLNSTRTTLSHLTSEKELDYSVYGFCGMPGFLNREILEVTTLKNESLLDEICSRLNTKFKIVDDRVGMITPRIICMIINEAYFAIEENVASREDIDLAMKLGTNYPFGPFEWSQRIGIKNVYELLKAVYEDTKDDRYRISAELEKEANSVHAETQSR